MVDYWTHLSVAMAVPRPAAEYAITLAGRLSDLYFEEGSWEAPDFEPTEGSVEADAKELAEEPTECEWVVMDDLHNAAERERRASTGLVELWVRSDENANIVSTASVIHAMLHKFDLPGAVVIHWSNTCSKPRLDAYGGGCVVVTKDGTDFASSYDWADAKLKELAVEAIPTSPPVPQTEDA